jgi:hypothetical protein
MSSTPYSKSSTQTITAVNWQHEDRVLPSVIPNYTDDKGFTKVNYSRTMNGYRLSNYQALISGDGDATTDFSATDNIPGVILLPRVVQYRRTSGASVYTGTASVSSAVLNNNSTLLTSNTTAVQQMAYSKFYNKMQASFQTYTFLAEAREAVHMIRNPAESLRKALSKHIVDAQKRRRAIARKPGSSRAKLKEFRRVASDMWLEGMFGWLPLVNDIQGGLTALNNVLADQPRQEVHRVSASQTVKSAETTGALQTSYYMQFVIGTSSVNKTSAHISAAVDTSLSLSTSVPSEFGLYPEQFIPTLWEVVPWSFLVDYFVNIGDVLSARATAQRLRYKYCSITTVNETEWKYRTIPRPVSAVEVLSIREGFGSNVAKKVVRSKLSSVPIPSLVLTDTLSIRHALNIGALIAGRRSDLSFRA